MTTSTLRPIKDPRAEAALVAELTVMDDGLRRLDDEDVYDLSADLFEEYNDAHSRPRRPDRRDEPSTTSIPAITCHREAVEIPASCRCVTWPIFTARPHFRSTGCDTFFSEERAALLQACQRIVPGSPRSVSLPKVPASVSRESTAGLLEQGRRHGGRP